MTIILLRRAVNLTAVLAVALTPVILQGGTASRVPPTIDASLQPRPVLQMMRPMLAATEARRREA